MVLECVPNFSEGRRRDVIERIASAAEVGGVQILDLHSDPDHNRSVLTLAGRPDSLVEAAVLATGEALRWIDLRNHHGQHPRMGSMDVIPFVPLGDTDMHHAIEAAMKCAGRIGGDLGIPVFLYGFAALRRHTRNLELPEIRKRAFELLTPDFGGPQPHPTCGATVVGAREILVAFNVELQTGELSAAKKIASSVRNLDHVRALAFLLESKSRAQVSMNLTKPEVTTIPDVYELVAGLASDLGVKIAATELVGLAPRAALGGRSPSDLGLTDIKILEDVI